MKAPGILASLLLMTLVFAYAEASPRSGNRDSAGLFGRSSASKYSCPLGSHYSSFYGECTRSFTHVSN